MKILRNAACSLAACLLMTGLPLPAAAQATFTYTVLDDGTAAVACADTAIVNAEIPAEIDGYTVTALAENCFQECTALETVTFPETVTVLNDYAFHGCEALDTITIPAGITKIGSFVFEGCTSLTEIQVSEENTSYNGVNGVLYTEDMRSLVRYPAAKADAKYQVDEECSTIEPWAFTDCSNLQSISMTSVTAIGADAFFCATSLTDVTLSEGLKELIGPTFAYCTNLKRITLPATLQTIGDSCFYGCVSLQGVTLPDGLVSIGEMAFYGCVQMKEITVPASVKSIGEMGIGYSVDPATNENAVIEGFEMKTVSGSKAFTYAKRNKIAYSAEMARTTVLLGILGVLAVLIMGGACIFVYQNRKKQEAALAAQREAEKLERKKARRNRKK